MLKCIQYIEHNMEHMGGPWGSAGHRIVVSNRPIIDLFHVVRTKIIDETIVFGCFWLMWKENGGFLKWGYPRIIQNETNLILKSMVWGSSILGFPHIHFVFLHSSFVFSCTMLRTWILPGFGCGLSFRLLDHPPHEIPIFLIPATTHWSYHFRTSTHFEIDFSLVK